MKSNIKKEELKPFIESYKFTINYAKEKLDQTLDTLEKMFPNKEIWVTEYGVGGFGGELRKYGLRKTHIGALHNDLMLMRFLSRPSISISSWHSFSQFLIVDQKNDGLKKENHLSFEHFALFAKAIRNSKSYVPLKNSYQEIESAAFTGGKQEFIVLLNTGEKTYKTKQNGEIVEILQLSPAQAKTPTESFQNIHKLTKKTLSGKNSRHIEIPPYSITRISFKKRDN